MKLKKALMTGVMMLTMSVAAVSAVGNTAAAEETYGGLFAALFGEDGLLNDVLPAEEDIQGVIDSVKTELDHVDVEGLIDSVKAELDQVDVEGIVGSVKEGLDQADSRLSEIIGKAKSELGDFSVESLEEAAKELLGSLTGDFDLDSDEFERIFGIIGAIRDEQIGYMKERNAGRMDVGDVQIVVNDNIEQGDIDAEEIISLCYINQFNYRKDEEDQLWLVSSAEDIVLFRQKNTGDGTYPVTDADFVEDGENYASSLEALYEGLGGEDSIDEILYGVEINRALVVIDLIDYLEEHPEIKGLEYDGEIRTREELETIRSEILDELSETGTEDAEATSEEETAEEGSFEGAPEEEAPVDETPAEEAPAEEAQVDETPAEEAGPGE